jgi:hypothetical protein
MSTLNIGTLRLKSGEGDRVALRLRTARALQAADLVPVGLPPASVLVVRQLTDPMPHGFGADRVRPRTVWERAVRGTIEAAARTARRPDEAGRIDPAADVVLFEDEAQLLACLIVALVHGRAGSSWWWKVVLARVQIPNTVWPDVARDPASLLAAMPEAVPAAIGCITRWRQAVPVARACSIDAAARCVAALIATYGLHIGPATGGFDPASRSPQEFGAPGERTSGNDAGGARGQPAWAWHAWVPREVAHARVQDEVQRLFGLALALRHGTAIARGTTPADSRWPTDAGDAHPVTTPDSVGRRVAGARGETAAARVQQRQSEPSPWIRSTDGIRSIDDGATASAVAGAAQQAERSNARRIGDTTDGAEPRAAASAPPELTHAADPAVDGLTTNSMPTAEREAPTDRMSRPALGQNDRRHRSAAPTRRTRAARVETGTPTARELPAVFSTEGVVTRLGGIFYLIHALQALHLPAAFERGWHVEETAGSWGALDLIARALLGRRFAERDPIWEALAHLARWPAERHRGAATAGALSLQAGWRDPAFRAPADWPVALDDPLDQLAWSATESRVWVWSRGAYLIAAGRSTAADRNAAVRRARGYHTQDARGPAALASAPAHEIPWMAPAVLPRGCPARLGRWAAAVAPAVLRRLRLALDASAGAPRSWSAPAQSVRRALAIPGRLYVTSSHVDVVIPMQRIDLRVRRAGLDRDPGWLPASGRVIYFHFT